MGISPYLLAGVSADVGGVLRNVAQRGQVPLASTATSGGKTRQDFRIKFPVCQASSTIGFVFVNKFIVGGTGETNGVAVDIRELAVEKGGASASVTFGGSLTHTVAAGATNDVTDMIAFAVSPGDILWLRGSVDFGASFASGKIYSTTAIEPLGVEQCWVYDPANSGNTILSTGSMSTPTGGTASFPFAPAIMIGKAPASARSVIGLGTSIEDGTGDHAVADGSIGGGHFRRAAYLKAWPYCSIALNGAKGNDLVAAHTLLTSLKAYHSDVWCGHGTNDLQSGTTPAATLTIMRQVWGFCSGLKITQTRVIPRVTSTDVTTSVANQTPIANFDTGQYRDTFNGLLATDAGVNFTTLVDNITSIQDAGTPTKWAARALNTTLTASCLSTAVSLSMTASPVLGEWLVCDPGGANQSTSTNARVYQITGSGPFVATFFNQIGVAQSNGATVKGTPSNDGTHPAPPSHALMATALAAVA